MGRNPICCLLKSELCLSLLFHYQRKKCPATTSPYWDDHSLLLDAASSFGLSILLFRDSSMIFVCTAVTFVSATFRTLTLVGELSYPSSKSLSTELRPKHFCPVFRTGLLTLAFSPLLDEALHELSRLPVLDENVINSESC